MAGTQKRAADEEPPATRTRSAKTAKTDNPASPAKTPRKGGKKGPKTSLGATSFKARALPLHVNITHTPPAIPDDETVNSTSADPGFIGTTSLVPTTFNTGSYGWKGNKRVTIEIDGDDGQKEKVHVMLTINATVMGSKNAKDEADEPDKEESAETHAEDEKAVEAQVDAGAEEKGEASQEAPMEVDQKSGEDKAAENGDEKEAEKPAQEEKKE